MDFRIGLLEMVRDCEEMFCLECRELWGLCDVSVYAIAELRDGRDAEVSVSFALWRREGFRRGDLIGRMPDYIEPH